MDEITVIEESEVIYSTSISEKDIELEEINKNLRDDLIKINFFNKMMDDIEKNKVQYMFNSDLSNDNESINSFLNLMSSGEKTTTTTAQIYLMMYSWLKKSANIYLKEVAPHIRIEVEVFLDEDNLQYDVKFHYYDKKIRYEIKSSQGKDSWQGSTHSTKKVPYFILINYNVDYDKKINKGDNTGFFKDGFFSMMIKLRKDQWVGEPKKDSSRTTFQLSMTDYSQEFLTENCVINGLVEPKKSYYRLIYDRIN